MTRAAARAKTRKKKPRVPVTAAVRLRAWPVVSEAVERAATYGVNRAFKHTDTPTRDDIATAVEQAVMGALADLLDFGDP